MNNTCMFMECCSNGAEVEEDLSECTVSSREFDVNALNVDHLTSTALFDAIQNNDWSAVDFFLDTGTFSFSPFQSYDEGCKAAAEEQSETWVVCEDDEGRLIWRQLPIHAAICYGAPFNTVKELIKVYPAGLRCADVDGNLPIHLAFRFNCTDRILRLILKAFPEGMEAVNCSGKLPLECAGDKMQAKFRLLQTFIECAGYLDDKSLNQKQDELEAAQKTIIEATEDLSKAKRELSYIKKFPIPTAETSSDRGLSRYWKKVSSRLLKRKSEL
ncbi:expressed unknown protein [Seminavis robusta]|uniref:Uncharacterized protein n=1 Tax=Seminavis robusta TaxID=568900 RepID=A0A9N8H8H0_9STRA|nr:expressed unknown protein [Seminavis robusta]|eukprot:Sro168_g074920.1 n/a (272) ;mRNA; r:91560-92375